MDPINNSLWHGKSNNTTKTLILQLPNPKPKARMMRARIPIQIPVPTPIPIQTLIQTVIRTQKTMTRTPKEGSKSRKNKSQMSCDRHAIFRQQNKELQKIKEVKPMMPQLMNHKKASRMIMKKINRHLEDQKGM